MTPSNATPSDVKHCGGCDRSMPVIHFKVCAKNGMRERHCMACKAARSVYAMELRRKRMRGVDIDAIHYKRGAVRTKKAAA